MANLPACNVYTCTLVIVDKFSTASHLIPLKGMPTAMKRSELLFNHESGTLDSDYFTLLVPGNNSVKHTMFHEARDMDIG